MSDTVATSSGDRLAAGLLLVLQAAGAVVCGFLGIMLVFVSDACSTSTCNTGMIASGMAITGVIPGVLWVVALIHVIARSHRGALLWPVPIVWMVVSAVAAGIGIAVAFSAGPATF